MRIYVAGPYSAAAEAERQSNVDAAARAGALLIAKGHEPFVPHLAHYLNASANLLGMHVPYEEWVRQDFVWLDLCDALLYLGPSPGADRELLRFFDTGKPIYRSVAEVPSRW